MDKNIKLGGLNDEDVIRQRKLYGKNELNEKKKSNIFIRFLLQFKDTLIIILLIAAFCSVIINPTDYVDSLIILIVVIINAFLGIYQENRAEKSLEALKKLSSPTCKVFRNNSLIVIPSSEIVVGDLIALEAGDFVSADACIVDATNLQVDESSLTGESLAINKSVSKENMDSLPIAERTNMLFSSTFITNGKAKAIVKSVGMQTEIGKIAKMLDTQESSKTPLQNKLNQVGKVIGLMSLIICLIVFVLEMISGLTWLDAFKTAIALAVAAIPEGLATVVTIVLAIGVSKMSKQNAIIKKLPAVETLGSTNIVCSDKTGTLTQNKMTVKKFFQNGYKNFNKLSFKEQKTLQFFAICCDASINIKGDKIERIGDPTELAILDINLAHGLKIKQIQRLIDLPFDSDRKLMTTVIKENNKYISITKGAPNVIFEKSINTQEVELAKVANNEMANTALRVLALAIKEFDYLPNVEELEKNLTYIGLIGMIDPERQEVKASIEDASKAGIRTIMITGDDIITATAIAKNLNILHEGELAISSSELSKLSEEELDNNIDKYSVYARVAPEDKVRIVSAWQKKGAVVAMTGDGVNDAPALKKADIGCAMGISGTDVSKESADMILTDDNFSTIISAVKQGRGIYKVIQRCVKYLLSSNIGEVLVIFLASLISVCGLSSFGVPLLPIHLLWINLITDSLPAFGIAMEEIGDEVMKEKPRNKKESFFAHHFGLKIAFEGFVIGLVTLSAYTIGSFIFKNQTTAQTMAFLTLSSTQLFHAFNVKNDHSIFTKYTIKNRFMILAFFVGFILQLFVIYIPGINTIFKLNALTATQFFICIGLSIVLTIIMEFSKLINFIKKIKHN